MILTANVNDTLADVDGYTYEWRLFNTTLGFTTNELDTVLEPNDEPYLFTVIVRNENGCTTTSDVFDVTVHQPVVVTAHTSETDVCVGGQVTVSAHLDNYNIEGLTYQWIMNGDSIEGATSAEYTTTLDTATTYTFEVLVAQPTTSCLSRATVTVNVHEDPTVSLAISDEDTVVCEGGQYTLTATAYYDEVLGEASDEVVENSRNIQLERLEDLLRKALDSDDKASSLKALDMINKLHGLYIEKKEVKLDTQKLRFSFGDEAEDDVYGDGPIDKLDEEGGVDGE